MKPILYHKPTCPYCVEAFAFFEEHNIELDKRDINLSAEDKATMEDISGQRYVPTLVYGDFVVPGFYMHELHEALNNNPEIKAKLGIQ